MPKMIAKLNDVSQSTILSPYLIKFHRIVTSDPNTSATANTVTNSTINFLMFIFLYLTGGIVMTTFPFLWPCPTYL